MAKGDDAVMRKKNKLNRKKQRANNDSATVSGRIAAIIAAKKRRLSGKRRMCQGMCFSLPTLEDPFNDGRKKLDFKSKKIKKGLSSKMDRKVKVVSKPKIAASHADNLDEGFPAQPEEAIIQLRQSVTASTNRERVSKDLGCPTKFLVTCLHKIEEDLPKGELSGDDEGKELFTHKWGYEFWKSYAEGKGVLETRESSLIADQIAWIASTAADDITRKEEKGLSPSNPFLLYIVPSQEKAIKVRSVCKALKYNGIHTVSIHAGAPIDHQVAGLKTCEPEFLVSTPERLLTLISMKAIDISEVSWLVVDGLEMLMKCGLFDTIKSVMQLIKGRPTVIISNSLDNRSDLVEKLLHGKSKIHKLPSVDSVTR